MDDFLVDFLHRFLQVIDDEALILERNGFIGLTGGQLIRLQVHRILVDIRFDVLVDYAGLLNVFILVLHTHIVHDLIVVLLAFAKNSLKLLHLPSQTGLILPHLLSLLENFDELFIFIRNLLPLLLIIKSY